MRRENALGQQADPDRLLAVAVTLAEAVADEPAAIGIRSEFFFPQTLYF